MPTPLYVCYGMPKSGSTLAFELTAAILEEAGIPQARLSDAVIDPDKKINFLHLIRPAQLDAALEETSAPDHPRPIALKTHGGVWNATAQAIRDGKVIGQAVARDPRDVALSMLDAAHEGRAWGLRDGRPLRDLEDAMEVVRGQVDKFLQWQQQPGFLTLNYEEVAFDTRRTVRRIAKQLGLEVRVARVLGRTELKFTQFNKGISQRWREEMPARQANAYYDEFAEFIEGWCLRPGMLGRA